MHNGSMSFLTGSMIVIVDCWHGIFDHKPNIKLSCSISGVAGDLSCPEPHLNGVLAVRVHQFQGGLVRCIFWRRGVQGNFAVGGLEIVIDGERLRCRAIGREWKRFQRVSISSILRVPISNQIKPMNERKGFRPTHPDFAQSPINFINQRPNFKKGGEVHVQHWDIHHILRQHLPTRAFVKN